MDRCHILMSCDVAQILGDDLAVYGGEVVSLVSCLDLTGFSLSSCVPIFFLCED